MSDFSSSLPIRTENNGDVVAKIADATTPSQQLAVNANGSINVEDGGSSITVDGTVELGATTLAALESITVQNAGGASAVNIQDGGNSITVDASNLDIRDLVFATDKVDVSGSIVALDAPTLAALESITVQNAAGASAVNIQDGGNSITVDATNLDIRDLTSASDSVEVLQTTHDDLNANANIQVGNADVANGNPVPVSDAGGSLTVDASDLDIRDLTHVSDSIKIGDGTDFLAVNSDGSINVVSQEDPGTERVNYDTTAAVAGGASDNHDFLFTNAAKLYQVWASASGKLKMTVQIETGSATGVFNTVAVGFNSTANPNIEFALSKYAAVPAGARVRVIRQNTDNQAQDVYSTIVGLES